MNSYSSIAYGTGTEQGDGVAYFQVISATKDELHKDEIKQRQLVWLQGIGWCKAKPLWKFKPGEKMGWNCGYISTVVALVHNKHGHVIGVTERWMNPITKKQEESFRKRRGSTLTVYLTEKKQDNVLR